MPGRRNYTLQYDSKNDNWKLVNDKSNRTVKSFAKKDEITGAQLRKALGREGGSVKIRTRTGTFEEERVYRPA